MTQLGNDKKPTPTFTQAIIMLVLLMAFVFGIVYITDDTDIFGEYESPITTGAPMLVNQDNALLIFLPGSTYYKFPGKAPQVAEPEPEPEPVVPAVVLPTAIPPKSQP